MELPEVGQHIEVEGGVIRRTHLDGFVAYATVGAPFIHKPRLRGAGLEALFRSAENALRRHAGLPEKPRLCAICAREVQGHAKTCSGACELVREHRVKSREQASQAFFDSLTTEDILARARTAAARRIDRAAEDECPPAHVNVGHAQSDPAKFRAAGKRADELIRRRGGIVPVRAGFWSYLAQYQAETYRQPQNEDSTPVEQSA